MYCACLIEYFGSHTIGWQSQPGPDLSVQNYIEEAIALFTGDKPLTIDCAGRTDKGVHALGQVIGFHTAVNRTKDKWITGLNRYLPPFIRICDWIGLPDQACFHPRFSAIARSYKYYIVHSRDSQSCFQGLVTPIYAPVNRDLLVQCAEKILGVHDFSAFQGGSCQAKTPIKTCHKAQWTFFNNLSVFEIQANAFLHHMVRYLVGSQIQVAIQRHSLQWFEDLLKNVGTQDYCAPPQALYLSHVQYPKECSIQWDPCFPWFDPRFHMPKS